MKVFRYAGTETGDTQVRGLFRAEAGWKMSAGELGHWMAGGGGGAGPISKLHNNNRWSLGPELSMSEVRTSPPHNSENPHGLVAKKTFLLLF